MKSFSILLAVIHLAVAVPLYSSSTTQKSYHSSSRTSSNSIRKITSASRTTTISSRGTNISLSRTYSSPLTTSTPRTTTTTTKTMTSSSATSTPSAIWQPTAGITWQYTLSDKINLDSSIENAEVWFIDLFDNTAADVASLHRRGRKVVAYFSAGTWENWRTDASSFNIANIGNALGDWPGEKWLDIRTASVRQMMLARMDLAAQKGFDGVDPDNMDGYGNSNGLGLSQADATDYALFLAKAAHARGLSIGLKNAGDIIPDVVSQMQWTVQEQSIAYNEEYYSAPFVQAGKPVFNVEYPKGTDASDSSMNTDQNVDAAVSKDICNRGKSMGFSTIIKNVNLNQWVQTC